MDKRIKREVVTLDILEDVYHFRALTTDQIRYLYYPDKKNYTEQKVKNLRDRGLLDSLRYERKACYVITTKGIRQLEKNGRLTKSRLAKDNRPDPSELWRIIQANDVFVYLSPFGFKVTEVREWKARYRMNRNSWVAAGVTTSDVKKDYSVYIMPKNISEKEISHIRGEIKEATTIGRYIFIFKSLTSYSVFLQNISNVERGKLEIMMISELHLRKVLPLFSGEQSYIDFYSKYGEVLVNDNPSSMTNFAEYILRTEDGEEYYICNYLFQDATVLERVKGCQNADRKVAVFTFQTGHREAVKMISENSPYIKFFIVDPNEMPGFTELNSRLTEIKEQIEERNEKRRLAYRGQRKPKAT
ncbi:replication-relaxation family protein [Anaerobacillus isosaccharinicus]|uniref:Replication-relaxation family protein n=1 Tax=Anaerobacillus isosaccharinicus TaxID=1532552 RepID=A0A7S7RD50_9BACI|nr:replication-relaxation family protein [Anaerobacillus isosaccharinicus]MBA5583974.1 replication-relaxation family protein [Anaerobacillus isosaccharinicus]QOY37608.1 replication-relaxation family protein [Anaerobacillus isosaccharinicus]